MLSITFITTSLRHVGGVTTFLYRMLDRLPRYGIDPLVIELEEADARCGLIRRGTHPRIIPAHHRSWQSPRGFRRWVVSRICSHRPHLIVTNDQAGWEYLSTFQGKVPIIDIMHLDHPNPPVWDWLAATAGKLTRLVAVSDLIRRKLIASGVPADRVVHIPYGVPIGTSRGADSSRVVEAPTILFVGRLVQKHKRARDLVAFLSKLRDELPDSSLIVVGDGPERTYLEGELRSRSDRVTFTGPLSPDEVGVHYERAHFLVQFSEYEGLSIVLLESMAHGVVPVVTAIESGVGQVIDDRPNGFLFPVGQPEMAVHLIKANLSRWAEVSANAFQTASERFNVDLMCRRYAALFRETAATVPLSDPPLLVEENYPRLRAQVARELLPISIYRGLFGRTP
jgi:glycosyltransferase involved in cell wall biosynthesis